MSLPQKKHDARFTFGDYLLWPDEERWELINGEAYSMSPGPGRWHQSYSGRIFHLLSSFFEDTPCEIFHAPFDVRFPAFPEQSDEDIDTVVQPDISVVCDNAKLDDRGCRGAPDLVVEILSPSTAAKDLREKFNLYESQGVREYWIVHPTEKIITLYFLREEKLYGKPRVYDSKETAFSSAFEGLEIDLKKIFREK